MKAIKNVINSEVGCDIYTHDAIFVGLLYFGLAFPFV